MKSLAILLIISALAAIPIAAQTWATLTGTVTDPGGAVVPAASVRLISIATTAVRQTETNAAGMYVFPTIPPGTYDIQVEKLGFQPAARREVQVEVQLQAQLDFELQVGAVQESISVIASEPLLRTDASAGTVIDTRRIAGLPLNGRNFLQLVSLAPNVSFGFSTAVTSGPGGRQGGARAEQSISIAGQRSELNHFTVDGIENTDVNFNTYIALPSIDALQEFKVQSGIYPAEFGREVGQINISTKSGSNTLHGALFEFVRNDKLDASTYDFTGAPFKDSFKWNQFGYAVGGPIRIPRLVDLRNRLFFLSNFEAFRERKRTKYAANVPTEPMRNGDFSGAAPIFDPLTRTVGSDGVMRATQFAGNIIPKDRIQPTSLKLLEFYPAPNAGTGGAVSNFLGAPSRRTDKFQLTERIDWIESQKSFWMGRVSAGNESQVAPTTAGGNSLVAWQNGTQLETKYRQGVLTNTRSFSPALVNDFRFGYNAFYNNFAYELSSQRNVLGELKIPGLTADLPPTAWGVPIGVITGFSTFGNTSDAFLNDNHMAQWVDAFAWSRGKHAMRFGGEVRLDHYDSTGNTLINGRFIFDGSITQNPAVRGASPNGFADFLLGMPRTSEGALALGVVRFRAFSQAFFFDDTWRLARSFTLSLGLRYENTPPWRDESGTLINAEIPFADTTPAIADPTRHPTLVRVGKGDFYEGTAMRFNPAIQVARDGRLGDRLVARDNNDFAPRLGIAWTPSTRWTVRTGAGLFYSQDSGNPRFDMARNLAGRRSETTNPDTPDLNWDKPFRSVGDTVRVDTPFVLAAANKRRTPYTIQMMFNIQHAFRDNTVLEAGYTGALSRKLEMLRFFNTAVPGTTGTVAARSPYPELGRIQTVDGVGKSNYHALALKAERRLNTFTFLAAYTWSRSIDTQSAIRGHTGDTFFPQNSNCIQCDRALSSFQTAHRLVGSALYALPFGQRHWWGGWQFGSIATVQTGFPLTVLAGTDRANVGAIGEGRPNATGISPTLPGEQRTTERFFNTAAFALQPFGTFGNAGRNTVIGPGLMQLDFSTVKETRIREGHTIQLRFEAFNLPNHPNWGPPGTTLSQADFGKVRSTRAAMREIQLGLKYIF